ncbi:MAG: adenylosuccinate synthetase, partial [Pseudomonadota bacterium]|nr:adenylosuccinate synthetase [Pseudomonadota bacterium]
SRRAVRLCDLYDPSALKEKLHQMSTHHNAILKNMGLRPIRIAEISKKLMKISKKLLPYVDRVWGILDKAQKRNQNILFEGAQGFALDVDHGTYPYVTSSNTIAGQANIGTGSSGAKYVLGITKAYTTRVGSGPFPTELNDKIGQQLGEIGNEYGTVTNRKRRCGWFDAVLVKQAAKISGINGIALTKLDVLDSFKEIKICTGYRLKGKRIDYFPSGMSEQKNVRPIYETIKGWGQQTRGLKAFKNLPLRSVKFIKKIEKLVGVPITMISTSERREDTILVKNPYSKR